MHVHERTRAMNAFRMHARARMQGMTHMQCSYSAMTRIHGMRVHRTRSLTHVHAACPQRTTSGGERSESGQKGGGGGAERRRVGRAPARCSR